jgi:hypothetical protein
MARTTIPCLLVHRRVVVGCRPMDVGFSMRRIERVEGSLDREEAP